MLQNQARGLWRWMEEMEVFLQADIAVLGDIDTLEAQLAESNVSYDLYIKQESSKVIAVGDWMCNVCMCSCIS